MTRRPEAGMAVCLVDDCDWTAEGPQRFNAAVDHREETGHETVASLSDAPGDDTGARVSAAFRYLTWGRGLR